MIRRDFGAAAVIAVFLGISAAAPAHGNVWVMPGEVSDRAAPATPRAELFDPAAPEIVVESPREHRDGLTSPVKVHIRFVPKNGARIVLESVKLIYVTFFYNIDITDRVRDKITASGIQDDRAELPSGSHRLIVKVSDNKGVEGEREFHVNVE